jgi:hypothetical protein
MHAPIDVVDWVIMQYEFCNELETLEEVIEDSAIALAGSAASNAMANNMPMCLFGIFSI